MYYKYVILLTFNPQAGALKMSGISGFLMDGIHTLWST